MPCPTPGHRSLVKLSCFLDVHHMGDSQPQWEEMGSGILRQLHLIPGLRADGNQEGDLALYSIAWVTVDNLLSLSESQFP